MLNRLLTAGLMVALVATATARADLVVYDPIPISDTPNTAGYYNVDEEIGSSHNRSVGSSGAWGGSGNWSGAWNNSWRWTARPGTLTYTSNGYNLNTSGGHLGPSAHKAYLHRQVAPSLLNSGTLYFSFLLESSMTDHNASEYYGLTRTQNRYETARLDYLSNGQVNPVLETAGKGTGASKGAKKNIPDGTNFYVLKVEFGSTSSEAARLTAWMNPGLGKSEAEIMTDSDYDQHWSITRTNRDFGLQYLLVRHADNSDTQFDEFRLATVNQGFTDGDAWSAVTSATEIQQAPMVPEPVTGLALLGGLAAIAWRRRRRAG
ncbi:MAG: PEP-CTERM sorting domain-containing protein [Planctomycetota bacterium]